MASFTVELRTVVESGINIFAFPYDFYDESKRREFERNFIRHFYFREIGCETVERFIWYLEDKMRTVFPYYNTLFEAAQIDYNILDNYNVKEEYEIRRQGTDKENNVSSSVGRSSDKQTTESKETREGSGNVTASGSANENVTETDVGTVERDGLTTQLTDMTTTTSEQKTKHNTRKFLDTPQGALEIADAKYLTNLTDDNETDNANGSTKVNGTVSTTDKEKTDSNATKTVEGNNTTNQTTTSADESEATTTAEFNGEHKLTHDNNTRVERVGDHVEKSVYTKKGNIGIDTDSDMITKHINLQKVLRNIERMFFDECEDLFMMVYE